MRLNILEDKKSRFVFEIHGEGHTLCNAIRDELWNDKTVKVSAYNIEHPLVGIPVFIIETDSKGEPKKSLKNAIRRLKKKNADLRKQIEKALK